MIAEIYAHQNPFICQLLMDVTPENNAKRENYFEKVDVRMIGREPRMSLRQRWVRIAARPREANGAVTLRDQRKLSCVAP